MENNDYIFIRTDNKLDKIKISDISYAKALGDYVQIFTKDKQYIVKLTLCELEARLPSDKFYRLHRSYLVRLDNVDIIEGDTAYVDKYPCPIGEQFKNNLLKKLKK